MGARRDARYCSPACKQRAYRERERQAEANYRNIEFVQKQCDYCTRNIAVQGAEDRLVRQDALYCGPRCRKLAYERRRQGAHLRETMGITLTRLR